MLKAFDYLDSIRVMKLRIQIKTRQAQQLRDTVSNITASMDEEHVSHTKNTSAMADAIFAIAMNIASGKDRLEGTDYKYDETNVAVRIPYKAYNGK